MTTHELKVNRYDETYTLAEHWREAVTHMRAGERGAGRGWKGDSVVGFQTHNMYIVFVFI